MKVILISAMIFCSLSCGRSVNDNTSVIIMTELGEIHASLDMKNAPVTTSNFLRYVDNHLFDSSCFYRVVRIDNQPDNPVKIEVIQGGRFENETGGLPPITHETTKMTGIRHRNGTISMARTEPGTASSEFFICIGDQKELDFAGRRNPDGQGFAAFGRVTEGMDIVKRIHAIKADNQYLDHPVLILEIKRD